MANKVEFQIAVNGMEDIKKDFSKISDSLEEFSKQAKKIGRELSEVGSTISILGAAISGPLVLAFNASAKSSAQVSDQVKRLQSITSDFQKSIAESIVPVFEKLNDTLQGLLNAFNSLDPAFRKQLLQGALLAGVLLTLGGVFTIVIGKTLSLASNLAGLFDKIKLFVAANSIFLAVAASIAVLVVLMFKFKAVADVVLSTFQTMFILIENGFLGIKIAFELTIASMLETLTRFSSVIGQLPSVLGAVVKQFGGQIQEASTSLRSMADADIQAVIDKTNELNTIITTGQGSWSVGFDDVKTKLQEFFAALNQGGAGSPVQGFFDGFKQGLGEIGVKINDLKSQGAQFAQTLQNGMATAFSDIILGAKSAGEAFKAFGQAMLKAIVDFIAQWLAFQILSKALALIGVTFSVTQAAIVGAAWAPAAALASLATLGSNAIPAAAAVTGTVGLANFLAVPKFAEGSGGIKDDTVGLFNKGEIVVPNTFSDAIKRGDLSLSGGGSSGNGLTIVNDFTGATFNGITDKLVEDIFTKASENIANRTLAFRSA